MLGACHRPRAPQSHGETLVPAVCPAGKGPPPPAPPVTALLQMGLV